MMRIHARSTHPTQQQHSRIPGHPQGVRRHPGVQVHCVDTEGMLAQIRQFDAAQRTDALPPVCTVNRSSHRRRGATPNCRTSSPAPTCACRTGSACCGRRMQGVAPAGAGHRLRRHTRHMQTHRPRRVQAFNFLGAARRCPTPRKFCPNSPRGCAWRLLPGSPSDTSWPEIARRLTEARPDILFVAYGHPRRDLVDRPASP